MYFVAAVIALALAGFFGVIMGILLAFHDKNPPPKLLAGIHGLFAIGGIGVLTFAVVTSADAGAGRSALILLAVAAVIGLMLVSFHGRGQRLPWPFWVAHALAALGGFVLLLVATALNL